jgi:polysaccharide biosynthesis protein PslG
MDQTRTARTLFGFRLRTLAAVVIVVTIGAAALALDLASEGLVYEYLWDVTGETAPEQQLLGFAQYLMRYTRAQPETAPFARIPQADVNPYGVNTFLDQEVLPERRERQVQLAAEAGFGWLRQQFRWDDLEIDGKGDFIDRRHDRDGDGDPDAISS